MKKPYKDYEDDETCLAPCKDRKWYHNVFRDSEKLRKASECSRRYYIRKKDKKELSKQS